ncbi:hypothetical protein PENSPDRAFT_498974 [Peniophora sp. CONT]|nr:hypothetical protein PENSPDRAFT_498974 [Peniophora sp. CONT]
MSGYFPSAHGTASDPSYYTPAGYSVPSHAGVRATSHDGIGMRRDRTNEMQSNVAYEDADSFAQDGKFYPYAHRYPAYPELSQTVSAAQGAAGYAYATPAHSVAPSAPLQPYSTEQSRSGYAATSPTGAHYAQGAVYTGYGQSSRAGEQVLSSPQAAFAQRGYPEGSLYLPRSMIVPSHGPRDTTSSLANALGPAPGSTIAPRMESPHRSDTLPRPEMGMPVSTPSSEYLGYSEYGSPYAEEVYAEEVDFQFVVETGSPASASSARSARGRVDPDVAEDAPRKRTNAPSKGPKKEQGFLACYFCRGRKIACNAPPKEAEDRTCEQCSKRKLPCEYPTISRRGQRNLDGKKKVEPDEQYVPKRARTEAHMAMQGGPSGYGYGN